MEVGAMQDMEFQSNDLGKIQIADEVIQIIAGLAASEIDGVVDLTGSFAGGLTESLLGRKNLAKGVRVDFQDEEKACSIGLSLVLDFGINIPQTCIQVQEHVKSAVEGMTGLNVTMVNVHVTAIRVHGENKELPEAGEKRVHS
ncbi:Asp23/Gls24 family envelope stress response protein [Alicyclobacillus mengziensis]|uniref:Asp23/Gls24 family envelope stress response protein n=2 Tax=Alicyclobacillus mengziensis TaxID=2931921 RepID=A0A9X7VY20_9BACL|nr:Asp23/Gls24 family envelope stress response protein [Alicyclobacillus mengziensis]